MRNLTKHIASLLTIRFHPAVIRLGGRIHLALFRLFHGKGPLGTDTLILTTRGRNTGEPRSTPLYYSEDRGRFHVAASFAGSDTSPNWYLNLLAHPSVEVEIGCDRATYQARILSPSEASRVWPELIAVYPQFGRYRQRTARSIPVIELTISANAHQQPLSHQRRHTPNATHGIGA